MTRIIFFLLLITLLPGCGGWSPAPAVQGWFVLPAVERLPDGTRIEWHDFVNFC